MIEKDGFTIEFGPDLTSESYERYFALVDKLGLTQDVIPTSTLSSFVRNGRPIDIDAAKPLSLVFTPLLSWPSKFRALAGALKLRSLLKRAHAYKLVGIAEHEDPSVHAGKSAHHYFGDEMATFVIDAVLRPLGGSHMDTMSSLVMIGALASWTKPLITIRGGLYRVPAAAAKLLDVTYNAPVAQISDTEAGVKVAYTEKGVDKTLIADGCVVATQYHDAECLYPKFKQIAGDYGDKASYCRIVDIKLAFSTRTKSEAFAVFVPTVEHKDYLVFSLVHNKAPDRAPAGHSLFTVFTDDAEWDKFNGMRDDEIIEQARQDIENYYPELQGSFQFGLVSRQPQTVIYADPGFYTRTASLLKAHEETCSRVQLGGDFFGSGSLEAAVIWGEQAADRLLRSNGRHLLP